MAGVDTNNNLGFFSKLKLTTDPKSGKMMGVSDTFIQAAEELYEGNLVAAKKNEEKKDALKLKMTALSALESKVADLKAKSAFLYNSDGLGNYGAFSNMFASYSSTSLTPVPQLMDLNLSSQANLQEFTLEIDQVASYDVTTSSTGVADPTVPLNWSGTYTINGQQIPIAPTMSLNDIATLFNIQTGTTNANSTVVKVSDTDYRLSIQSTVIGTPITIANGTTGTIAGNMPAASGKQPADLGSSFKFNGISMKRNSNTVSDILPGLTIVLKKQEPGTVVSVQLAPDTDSIKDAIRQWVGSVNELMDEVNKSRIRFREKKEAGDPEVPNDAPLLNTDVISTLDSILRGNLTQKVMGLNSNSYSYMEEIGLKVDNLTNKITIDEQVLDQALKSNPNAIESLFDYKQTITNNKFISSSHPTSIDNGIIVDSNGNKLTTSISVNKDANGNLSASISVNGGIYSGQTFTVPGSALTASGDVISFLGDSISNPPISNPFAGFRFSYIGVSGITNGGSDSTTIQFTQGITDRISKSLDEVLSDSTGDFASQKEIFNKDIERLNKAIEQITERAEKRKQQFLEGIARMEAALQALKPAQDMIAAITHSMSNGR